MEITTPMMAQYFKIKEQYKDCILMYRLGDFYEMFYEDAEKASQVLEIALTARNSGKGQKAPMCGVPFHAADSYIARLVSDGNKVAICEQAEDPKNAKGIVKREVIRVVTPGTILDDSVLSARTMNYMCCIYKVYENMAVAFAEASTGEILATFIADDKNCDSLISELERFSPVEIIMNADSFHHRQLKEYIDGKLHAMAFTCPEGWFDYDFSIDVLQKHFGHKADDVSQNDLVTGALGCLMHYLKETQKAPLTYISDINFYHVNEFMEMDATAQRNLELLESMRDKNKRSNLLGILDKTKTSMGLRTLKKWIIQPLLNVTKITERQEAVEELMKDPVIKDELCEQLKKVYDIERLMGKVSLGTANPKDLLTLKVSFANLPKIKQLLKNFSRPMLSSIAQHMDTLEDMWQYIERAIDNEAPISVREGRIIKKGFCEELDKLNADAKGGREWIAQLEAKERERTGIKNLKVGFNKVFGYYIEVSNSNLDKVPENYMRKQTLTGGERFITPELKEKEEIVLGAQEKVNELEYRTFVEVRNTINDQITRIQKTARQVAVVDVLASFAEVAVKNGYCMPTVTKDTSIDIKMGRHPVVEQMMAGGLFVPNDTFLNTKDDRFYIITGPNMAGKSTYMRQVALIVLMAQIGSFVPAKSCVVGIVDKIFTRVGASDDLSAGQSTFMVEMSEVAAILKNATSKSLLILDEIGRGTSTYDGLSIAWAVIEYCCKKIGAKALFATHYHELTELEGKIEGVKNYCVAVKKRGDEITFLRKIIRGGADQSYGIEVAKIAGVPTGVIRRAKFILQEMEESDVNKSESIAALGGDKSKEQEEEAGQIRFTSLVGDDIVEELKKMDVTTLTPIEALNILYDLHKRASEVS